MRPSADGDVERTRPARGDVSGDGASFYDGADWGWQPLWLQRDAVLAACREQFGITATAAELLAGGYLNQNWLLRCADHDRVLRVGRPERTREQVAYELALTSAWAAEIGQIVLAETATPGEVDGHLLTLFPIGMGLSGPR